MTKREAYRLGFSTGDEIAETQASEPEAKGMSCDELLSSVLETESDHYRQYSPFEDTAREFNDARNPDGMWEAYERGVAAGARRALRQAGCRRRAKG